MTLTPRKIERIALMFTKGFSLDLVSEWGASPDGGWTREEAKSVVASRGWVLGWDGRLQDRYMAKARLEELPLREAIAASEADVERMLAVGMDHEVGAIRQQAVRAQRAIDELRRLLEIQEQKDAEAVARERERKALLADPSRIKHGSWGGYLMHRKYDIPTTPQCGCDDARDAYSPLANRQAQQAS